MGFAAVSRRQIDMSVQVVSQFSELLADESL
jgi:hypothetical protein